MTHGCDSLWIDNCLGVARPAGDEHAIHSPYDVSFVIEAEDYLLRSVCSAVGNHPAVWSWSLGNEPDLFHRPASAAAGRRWVRARVATIREVDPDRPVLIGLHYANMELTSDFRFYDIAIETDISVMHGYPMYTTLARHALDSDFVPFTAALSAALARRPVLYESSG